MTPPHRFSFLPRNPADFCASLILLIACAFWFLTLSLPFFTMDDPFYITGNPLITRGLSLPTLSWSLTTNYLGFWIPLTWLSLALDSTLFGVHPWAYHLTNTLLHLGTVLLLFAFFRRLRLTPWPSLLATLLFAIHPLRVESVAWATERKDVLALFFGMLTLHAYLTYVRRPRLSQNLIVCLLFAASLMAKPLLVTLPFALLLLDLWPLHRKEGMSWTRLVREKLPLFFLAAAVSVDTLLIGAGNGSLHSPLALRLTNIPINYLLTLRDFFDPHFLCIHDAPLLNLPAWQWLSGYALLLSITALFLTLFLRKPKSPATPLLIGWLFFLGAFFPMSGIFQSGYSIRADRFTYFPSLGLSFALIWGLAPLLTPTRLTRRIALCIAALFLAFLLTTSINRLLLWRDPLTLMEHDLPLAPNDAYLEATAGTAALDEHQDTQAALHFQKAHALDPREFPYTMPQPTSPTP